MNKLFNTFLAIIALVSNVMAVTISFTTDGPSGDSKFIKPFVSTDLVPGVISVTVTNDDGTLASEVTTANTTSKVFLHAKDKDGNITNISTLKWQDEIFDLANSSGTYTFKIKAKSPGSDGNKLYIGVGGSSVAPTTTSTQFAYIDQADPTTPARTAPLDASTQTNFIGQSTYNLTATGNYSSVSSSFQVSTGDSLTVTDTYKVVFQGSNDVNFASGIVTLGEQVLGSATATATGNFSTSGNRLSYIRAVALDAAGNDTAGSASGNMLATKWLALGQFKDRAATSWHGSSTVAHTWTTANTIFAGNSFDLKYYATDFYGTKDSTYQTQGNVKVISASANVPNAGYNGTAADTTIGTANLIGFNVATNGTVTYSGCLTLYRQENVKLGVQHDGGTLYAVDSNHIKVRHNIINDVIFTSSTNLQDSNYGVNSLTPTISSATAGSAYTAKVAIVDQYWNVCNTSGFGGTGNITVTGNFNNAYAHGYQALGASALSYPPSYSNNYVWSTNGTTGVIDVTDVTLYRAETGNLILGSTGPSNNNTNNDQIQLTVNKATTSTVYFDNNSSITDGLLANTASASGNGLYAGNAMTSLYGHITDTYGNLDSTSTLTISTNGFTDASGNAYTTAYRNDASVWALSKAAVAGTANLAGLRVDRATGSGNSTFYPFSKIAFTASATGLTTSTSPGFTVTKNTTNYVYFANNKGEPTSSANSITSATAGTDLTAYAAIGDKYGNVDTANTTSITLMGNGMNAAPDGTTAPANDTSTNTTAGINKTGDLAIKPVKMENGVYLTLTSGTYTPERSTSFNVSAGTVTQFDFITSAGANITTMSNQTAGTAFTVRVGAMDQYKNINASHSTGNIIISGNGVDVSPAGTSPSYGSAGTYTSGNTSHSITLNDADTNISLVATGTLGSGSAGNVVSPQFSVSAATANKIGLVNSASLTNIVYTSSSGNTVTSTTNQVAGNAFTLYGAVLDTYGNLATQTGALQTAAPTSNAPTTSPSGNAPSYATATLTNSIATLSTILYTSESSLNLSIKNSGTGNSLTAAALGTTFNVANNSTNIISFTTSSGAYIPQGNLVSGTTSTDGTPIPNAGLGAALDGIYLGFFDAYGNPIINVSTGSVTLAQSDTAQYQPTLSSNPTLNISGNTNSNGLVYFSPSVSTKQVKISASGTSGTKLKATATGITGVSSLNQQESNIFQVTDKTVPIVNVTYPNGGEKIYPGTWNITWSMSDSNLAGGNYFINYSTDGGTTWSSNLITANNGSNTTGYYSWTVTEADTTKNALVRVTTSDNALNKASDTSDAVFEISPAKSVVSYAVTDVGAKNVNVVFREPVYSLSGASLQKDSLSISPTVTVSSVTHTAGTDSATMVLASALTSGNINSSAIIPATTGNTISKNSDGTSPYTTSVTAANVILHQLAVNTQGVSYTTGSGKSQKLFGLRLVGWDDDSSTSGNSYLLSAINVTIDQVSGTVSTSDFNSASTDSSTSGIGLFDSNGNALTLTSAPSIAIGTPFDISYTGNLSTSALATGTNNFFLGVATSSTISDSIPDAFKVTINSIAIKDTEVNLIKNYVPYGTRTTDPVVADVTAPAAPTITYTTPVNSTNKTAVSLKVSGEANSRAYYTFKSGSTSTTTANVVLSSSGVATVNNISLSSLGDSTSANVSVYLVDTLGNSGSTSFTTTDNLVIDTTLPTNATVTMSNIISTNATSSSVTLKTSETATTFSLNVIDSAGNKVETTGSIAGTSTTLYGLDFSSLKDGTLTANIVTNDMNGNSAAEATATSVTKDTVAPGLTSLAYSSSKYVNSGNASAYGITITPSSTEAAKVSYTITDILSNVVSGSVDVTNAVVAQSLAISTLNDGALTIAATPTDTLGNQGATKTISVIKDTSGPAKPALSSPVSGEATVALPKFAWSPVTGAATYKIVVTSNSSNVISAVTSDVAYTATTALTDGTYSWTVTATDEAGNVGTVSSTETFSVNTPVLQYLVGDVDSPNVKAVFNMAVYSSTGAGSLSESNFTSTNLGGVASVTHIAGTTEASVSFSKSLTTGSTNNAINVAVASASSTSPIYSDVGNSASSTNVTVKQLAAMTNITGTEGLFYNSTTGIEALAFKLTGWSGSNVKLSSLQYKVIPVIGSVSDSDFASAGSEIVFSTANGSAISLSTNTSNGFVGKTNTFSISDNIYLSTSTTSVVNYGLSIVPASSITAADSGVKVVKVQVDNLTLDVDGTQKTYVLAGENVSKDIILSNLSVSHSTATGNVTTDEKVTVTATNGDASATYSWKQTSGVSLSLTGEATSSLSFTADTAGDYVFELSYTRSGYTIVKSYTVTIVTKEQSQALTALATSVQSTTATDAEIATNLNVIADFAAVTITAGSTQANDLVTNTAGVLTQISNSSTVTITDEQTKNILNVLDSSIDSTAKLSSTAFTAALSAVNNLDALPAISSDQVEQSVKLIDELNTQSSLTETQLATAIENINMATIKSIFKTGKSSLSMNRSSDVKTSAMVLKSGDSSYSSIDDGQGGIAVSVTVSSTTLSELSLSLESGKKAAMTSSKVKLDTAVTGMASDVYEIKAWQTDGTTTSNLSVKNLSNPIKATLKIPSRDSTKQYVVKYYDETSKTWLTSGVTTNDSASTETISFETTHLTRFAVFAEDKTVTATPVADDGGGCFLK